MAAPWSMKPHSLKMAPQPSSRNMKEGDAAPPQFDLAFPPLPHTVRQPPVPSDAPNGSTSLDNNGRASFAALVAKPRVVDRFTPIELPPRQYGTRDGCPLISFTAAELTAGAKRFEHTLIAKFTIGRPPLKDIRLFLDANWRIKGRMTISDIWDGRHVAIILDSEEDVRVALTSPSRKIGHAFFRLFRWSVDYNPRREATMITAWIRLPGLPLRMYDKSYIRSLVSSFANFLGVDARTRECCSLNYARACVELDVSQHLPSKLLVQTPDGEFYQDIVYEGNLSYCSKCCIHGHSITNCRKIQAATSAAKFKTSTKKGPNDGPEHQACTIPVTIAGNSNGSSQPSATQKDKMEWIQVKKKKAARVVGAKTSEVSLDKGVSIPSVIEQGNSEVEQASFSVSEEATTEVVSIDQHHNIVVDQLNLGESVGIISDEGNNDIDDTLALVVFHDPTNQQEETLLVDKNLTTQDDESINPASAMILNNELDDNILLPDLFLTNVGGQFYCEQLGGKIFQDQEEFAKFAEENGYVQEDPVEEHEKGDEVPDVIHNSANKSRQRKKKGHRSSGRSCPKKKDKNFVWS